LHSLWQKVPILYNGRPYPPELPLPMGDLDLPCNTWCFRPMRVHNPNGTSIGSAVFAQMTAECLYTVFHKKTGPFVISSYLCFGSYKLHEDFQKYIGGVACCEHEINVCESLTILCWYRCNETTESYHVNKSKTRFILMKNICLRDNKTQQLTAKL